MNKKNDEITYRDLTFFILGSLFGIVILEFILIGLKGFGVI